MIILFKYNLMIRTYKYIACNNNEQFHYNFLHSGLTWTNKVNRWNPMCAVLHIFQFYKNVYIHSYWLIQKVTNIQI